MKRVVLVCYLILQLCPVSVAQPKVEDTWDLVRTYNASTHVFYGELTKVIPEPLYQTGVMGVHFQDIAYGDMPLQQLIWEKGKHLTFSVDESFKGQMPGSFVAYRSDHDLNLWTYVKNDAGDVFLSPQVALDPLVQNVQANDRALFFVRYYLGSNIPVLYHVRVGQRAADDLELLRAQKAAGNVSLDMIVEQAQMQQRAIEAREAAEFKVFEDEYYKILRIKDLQIRRSLFNDLIVRMGFEGRWSYYDFKERYLEAHGAYLEGSEAQAVPSGPTGGKEKLWNDISQELNKMDVIQKARARKN
ncbi:MULTISPECIES: hypothetical protein [unclassified Lentimonas]|uniref:hypothetical protein n=1 Tax=unclassified Lentimonas TaxID=2630993 RepID=UPI001329B7BB|nr:MULTISPECIES: hypothetical protein [unclassified Lentimonas]CAA6678716.1 Unannotated [Lentimonas sp. CC4]CAA6683702.1 Unannotated [Lentimonas sp. CC6]CAA7074450.1 Unannotated [Lentimonas sp. CC4]CAA7169060.1 Unannotated [Lentimonas sp. CC21]CAA7180532.1 Unannotated [Lentimonas sp. CC8]